MIKRLLLLCLLVAVVPVLVVVAQDAPDDELSDYLAEYVFPDEPGVIVYIAYPDEAFYAVAGLANLETGESIAAGDLFRIASVSKPLVSAVVLQLAEAGMIDLDAPIADYIPADLAARIDNAETATVRQMLQMTSGIVNYTESDAFDDAVFDDPGYMWTAEETLTFIYDDVAYFAPGADYYYSNSNYTLAQVLIETVTGNSLADELESRIFAPAGMDSCYLETPDAFAEGIVRGYQVSEDGGFEDITEINDGVGLGDGGIVCSAADLAKFLPALMDGVYLDDELLDQMLDTVDDGEGGNYGLGIGYDETDYGMVVNHDGATSGFQSSMSYFPDDEVVIVILTNNFDSEIMEDLSLDLRDYLLWDG